MRLDERIHVLGVRHHGPGSAASVLDALTSIDPAAVLIEGPADAEEILPFAAAAGMRPPLAILIHPVNDPADAIFFPFAEYSPEWQALRWALAHGRTVRFIDLPASNRRVLKPADEANASNTPEPEDSALILRDPLGALALAAGESDGEAWWNALVEQSAGNRKVFPAIGDAMTAVRTAFEENAPTVPSDGLRHEDLREAHMRVAIRAASQKSDGTIVVICGAWHVPALQRDVTAKADRDLLKGLERHKTAATWVPWTDTRLATASGYGAGVISPGWYGHLWRSRQSGGRDVGAFTAGWQSRVAALLRNEGLLAATASVIDAARLAISLAAASIFAAVMASIPTIATRLVVFDTSVADLTDMLADPVDVLFGVQLGGGTDINQAFAYCQNLVRQPTKTHMILITDLFEGGDRDAMLARAAAVASSGVNLIVLLALNDQGRPAYDTATAQVFASLGVPVFACTPDQFPDLMATALRKDDVHAWAAEHGSGLVRDPLSSAMTRRGEASGVL